MTRFPALWSLLTGKPVPSQPVCAREEALTAYRQAESRGDTRAMHAALQALVAATSAALAASLREQPARARGGSR